MTRDAIPALVLLLLLGGTAGADAPQAPPAHQHNAPPPAALPGESLYQLGLTLDTSAGEHLALAALAGAPVVVTMFYSSCTTVCPILTQQMQRIAAALDAPQRARVRFVMVSFDAERDGPERLAAFVAEHHLATPPFIVAHAAAGDVRLLAAALGIRYRQLPDRSFSHSAVITLLDAGGVPRARVPAPAADDAAFLGSVRALLR